MYTCFLILLHFNSPVTQVCQTLSASGARLFTQQLLAASAAACAEPLLRDQTRTCSWSTATTLVILSTQPIFSLSFKKKSVCYCSPINISCLKLFPDFHPSMSVQCSADRPPSSCWSSKGWNNIPIPRGQEVGCGWVARARPTHQTMPAGLLELLWPGQSPPASLQRP